MPSTPADSDRIVTRRRVLTGGGTLALGALGLAALPSERATANVTMGELSVTGDEATVDSPPEAITISASGEYRIDGTSVPEMVRTTLQVHLGSEGQQVDDLTEASAFGVAEGTFDVEADLFDHVGVSPGDLTPADEGESKTTTLLVRIVVSAVDGGSVVAENWVQEPVDVTLSKAGLTVAVGATADVEVVAG